MYLRTVFGFQDAAAASGNGRKYTTASNALQVPPAKFDYSRKTMPSGLSFECDDRNPVPAFGAVAQTILLDVLQPGTKSVNFPAQNPLSPTVDDGYR